MPEFNNPRTAMWNFIKFLIGNSNNRNHIVILGNI